MLPATERTPVRTCQNCGERFRDFPLSMGCCSRACLRESQGVSMMDDR